MECRKRTQNLFFPKILEKHSALRGNPNWNGKSEWTPLFFRKFSNKNSVLRGKNNGTVMQQENLFRKNSRKKFGAARREKVERSSRIFGKNGFFVRFCCSIFYCRPAPNFFRKFSTKKFLVRFCRPIFYYRAVPNIFRIFLTKTFFARFHRSIF